MNESLAQPPEIPSDPLRLFIALDIPRGALDQVTALGHKLQKGIQFTPCHPSWVPAENRHLTLVFLGSKPPEAVKLISQAMDRILCNFSQLKLEFKRLDVFPSWRRPKVLWIGVRDRTHQIGELRTSLEKGMYPFGYEPDPKPFRPHLTLARFRSLKGVQAAKSVIHSHQGFRFGPFRVGELILFQSDLSPAGASYTVLHRSAFTGQAENIPTKVASR